MAVFINSSLRIWMLYFLPRPLIRLSFLVLITAMTTLFGIPVYVVALFRILVPIKSWNLLCARWLMWIVKWWMWGISGLIFLHHRTLYKVDLPEGLRLDDWYFVNANHQSWSDILVLLHIFNGKIPFIKFFLKQELIWVPILGGAWWALDYPFMKRYSRQYLEKHPEKKGKDLESTRRSCARFKNAPVSIMNFLEGTRFTREKFDQQQSGYDHLLSPKAGGFAYALSAMEGKIRTLLDVTVVYPVRSVNFWEYVCGKYGKIVVHIERVPIPAGFIGGDYQGDADFRLQFQQWVADLWRRKDQRYAQILEEEF